MDRCCANKANAVEWNLIDSNKGRVGKREKRDTLRERERERERERGGRKREIEGRAIERKMRVRVR